MNGVFGKIVSCTASAALAVALVPAAALAQTQEMAQAQAQAVTPVEAKAAAKRPSVTIAQVGTGKVTLAKGSSYKLGAKTSSGAKLGYKSSKKKVATVSKKGMLKAKKAGKATVTVTAKSGKKAATKKIKVMVVAKKKYKKVKRLKLKLVKPALKAGGSTKAKISFTPKNASNKNVIYKSSNPSVVTVSASGKVKAKAAGTAKITATSCANGKAKASIKVKALTKNGFDPDTGLYQPEKMNDNYKPNLSYQKDIKTISAWSANSDGTYRLINVPEGLTVGDILVLEPNEASPEGAVMRIGSITEDGNVAATSDAISVADIYDSIDVEGTSLAAGSTFTPAEGVEAEVPNLSSGVSVKANKWTSKTIRIKDVNADNSYRLSEFTAKVGDLSFTVKGSLDFKLKWTRENKLENLYVAAKLNQSVSTTAKLSELLGTNGKFDQKLGDWSFATKVPGLYVKVAFWASASADGKVKFTIGSDSTLGVKYTEEDGWGGISNCVMKEPAIEFDASLKTGLDLTVSADILAKPIVDVSIGPEWSAKYESAKEKHRDTGLICNDVADKYAVSVEVGKHDSMFSDFGLSWERKYKKKTLAKWHFEDFKYVPSCTYKKAGNGGGGGSSWSDSASDTDERSTDSSGKPGDDDGKVVLYNGSCGENSTWSLSDDGTLTISGTGSTHDYVSGIRGVGTVAASPWGDANMRALIKRVIVENGITRIGNELFAGLAQAETISLPKSVCAIGDYAFLWCNSLGSMDLSSCTSLTSIGIGCFRDCAVETVSLPDSIEVLPNEAFDDCGQLKEVSLPASLKTIGNYAFGGCEVLEHVTIPPTVSRIGDGAFYACGSLVGNVTIPETTESIGDSAFWSCRLLDSVIFANNSKLKSIGKKAFQYDEKLISISIPDTVSAIGSEAFGCCTMLVEVHLPSHLTSISDYCFNQCLSLNRINVPLTLTYIGIDAFYNCSSLKKFAIPDTLTDLKEGAFQNCSSLDSVIIPDNIDSISRSTFRGCSSLKTVTFGSSVRWIGALAFYDCSSLSYAYLPAGIDSVWENAFGNMSPGSTLAVGNENLYEKMIKSPNKYVTSENTTLVKA